MQKSAIHSLQMMKFEVPTPKIITMHKDSNFIGQPVLSQLLSFIDKREIDFLARKNKSDRYTKKLTTTRRLNNCI